MVDIIITLWQAISDNAGWIFVFFLAALVFVGYDIVDAHRS